MINNLLLYQTNSTNFGIIITINGNKMVSKEKVLRKKKVLQREKKRELEREKKKLKKRHYLNMCPMRSVKFYLPLYYLLYKFCSIILKFHPCGF